MHQFLIKYKNVPLEIEAKNVPLLFFMLDVTLGLHKKSEHFYGRLPLRKGWRLFYRTFTSWIQK